MKKLLWVFAVSALFVSQAFATPATDWANRGLGAQAVLAKQAAEGYEALAASASDRLQKADFLTSAAEAWYYWGERRTDADASKDERKTIHERGYQAADKAIALMSSDKDGVVPVAGANPERLAEAHYFSAINLGKWGEANGVLSSLRRWPELKGHLDAIDNDLKLSHVQEYGSYRTRARALHKLPFGSKSEAEALLRTAYNSTLVTLEGLDIELSKNSTTTFFYLDIMVKNNNVDDFCEVYDMFQILGEEGTDEDLKKYNSQKVPETKVDLKNFLENKEFEENVAKFYQRNC